MPARPRCPASRRGRDRAGRRPARRDGADQAPRRRAAVGRASRDHEPRRDAHRGRGGRVSVEMTSKQVEAAATRLGRSGRAGVRSPVETSGLRGRGPPRRPDGWSGGPRRLRHAAEGRGPRAGPGGRRRHLDAARPRPPGRARRERPGRAEDVVGERPIREVLGRPHPPCMAGTARGMRAGRARRVLPRRPPDRDHARRAGRDHDARDVRPSRRPGSSARESTDALETAPRSTSPRSTLSVGRPRP